MSDMAFAIDEAANAVIIACLRDHPEVAAASLVMEPTVGGESFQVAYVVPNSERMLDARKRIYKATQDKRISQWRMAFDQTYRLNVENTAPSFVGWTDSYTNRPLPQGEMLEWLEATVDRILTFRPVRLLEIGCGVGLLVERVAPHCAYYVGTDLSPVGIARLRDFAESRPELRHVALLDREAVDLGDRPSDSVDTVVINSVVQYFPDLAYLQTVIGEAARVVSSGGRIIIGDVRHLGLLPLFHSAVQLAKAPSHARVQWLRSKVSLSIEHERELCIDPAFFLALPDADQRIGRVEVLAKRGNAHNELTRYRYDVVLHIGDLETPASCSVVDWAAYDQSITEITARLQEGRFTSLMIENVPNRRLAGDISSARLLWSTNDEESVEAIRDALAAAPDCGVDPEDFWALSDAGLCDVSISVSPDSADGRFNVTLVALDQNCDAPRALRDAPLVPVTPRRLATDPLAVTYQQQLGSELHRMLRDRLPTSSLPAVVLAVGTLPSTGPRPWRENSLHCLADSPATPARPASGENL